MDGLGVCVARCRACPRGARSARRWTADPLQVGRRRSGGRVLDWCLQLCFVTTLVACASAFPCLLGTHRYVGHCSALPAPGLQTHGVSAWIGAHVHAPRQVSKRPPASPSSPPGFRGRPRRTPVLRSPRPSSAPPRRRSPSGCAIHRHCKPIEVAVCFNYKCV